MRSLCERIHAVTYFADESLTAAREVGYNGFFMGYFAMRAAPLGPVGPAEVTASFFGFAAALVHRALPDAWTYLTGAGARSKAGGRSSRT